MAAGLPVAATDAGGNAELVVHGQTGLLSPRRGPRELADNLLSLLSDERAAAAWARPAGAGGRCSTAGPCTTPSWASTASWQEAPRDPYGQDHPRPPDRAAIRVLHVRTVRGNGGGPEKTILLGARYLPPLGVRSEALYLLDANTPSHALLDRLKASGMPVTSCTSAALDVAGPAAFARLVQQGRFDIVHAHDYKSDTLARFLAATGTYRIVATAHGYNQTTTREAYYYALEELLLGPADAVICPSAQLADLLADSGVRRRRLSVVSNGIELDAWTFRPRRRHDTPVRCSTSAGSARRKTSPTCCGPSPG